MSFSVENKGAWSLTVGNNGYFVLGAYIYIISIFSAAMKTRDHHIHFTQGVNKNQKN